MIGVDQQGNKLMNMLLKGLVGAGLGLGVATAVFAQDQVTEQPTATEEAAPASNDPAAAEETPTEAPATQEAGEGVDEELDGHRAEGRWGAGARG